MLVQELECLNSITFHSLPVIRCLFIFLIKEVQLRPIRHLSLVMSVIGIGRPGKINYILCSKMPGKLAIRPFKSRTIFLIAISNFIRVLKLTSSSNYKSGINSNVHIKVSPWTMKFTGYILIGMPALKIIFRHLRIPLRHRVCNSFAVISARPAYLRWHLRLKFHFKDCLCFGKHWLGQCYFHYRTFNVV